MDDQISRYAIEHSLVSNVTMTALLSPAHLKGAAERHPGLRSAHIYAVCTRPRITVPSDGIAIGHETMRITFHAQIRDDYNEITFERPNSFGIPGLSARSAWPHNEVVFYDEAGNERLNASAAVLLTSFVNDRNFGAGSDTHEHFLDLEVVYVGRAYSKNGRNAVDRLMKHETLQRVQADVAAKRPDLDVWLIPMAFNAYSMIGEFGSWAGTATDEEELAHAQGLDAHPVPEEQRVALTEGALIRYLDPRYNQTLKRTFPSPAHRDYAAVYARELIGAGFDLETTPLGARLRSETRAAAWAHAHVFSLRSDEEKKSLLDLADAASL